MKEGKHYIGTKEIIAFPMNRADYNDYRNWELPDDEDGEDEGYLVEYKNGGVANDSRHAGYISWSPKEVFEEAYKEISDEEETDIPDMEETFEDRLLAERDNLQSKVDGLKAFLGKGQKVVIEVAGAKQHLLLERQFKSMRDYLSTLNRRITDLGLDVK